uniref:Kinesin-like protein n=1 Tax=Anolis carolinensis TaxID=28377 RepID=A0A803TK80_ANOCA
MSASLKRITAFARVKPTSDFPQDVLKFRADNKTIDVFVERDVSKGVVNNKQTNWSFKLDGVLHNASQDMVYNVLATGLVSQALNGYNGTIMCYGQTGAGKTYTMTGMTESYLNRGIIPRAIQQVFKSVEEHGSQFITVRISYMEIYNETIFDLLSMMPLGAAMDVPLSVVESPYGVSVKGLTIHPAPTEEVALNLLFEGNLNRSVGQHALNTRSSRSHCIFTIYIECHSRILSDARYVTSKINLVDLAGSERLAKSKSEGQGLKEATYINKSLSFLEQVILALSDRNREHIPFRQSKLTYTLKDSLGGNCNTVLVANICSEAIHIIETLSTLRFASRMKWVMTEPIVNEKFDAERMVKNLEKDVLYLKEELAMHNSLVRRGLGWPGQAELRLGLVTMQVKHQEEMLLEHVGHTAQKLHNNACFSPSLPFCQAGLVDAEGHLVGEVDGQGFGIGVAPFSSKPGGKKSKAKKGKDLSSPTSKKEGPVSPQSGKEVEPVSPSRSQVTTSGKEPEVKETRELDTISVDTHRSDSAAKEEASTRPSSPPARPAAFEDFKNERGSEINRIFKENKGILNDRKKKLSEVAHRLNLLKQEMDTARQALEAQKLEREQQGEYLNDEGQIIIDEEEFLLIMKLKDLRKQYRADYSELRDLRSEVQYCQHLVDQCRNRLLTEFDIWYNESFLIPEEVQEVLRPGGAIRLGMIPINRVLTLVSNSSSLVGRLPTISCRRLICCSVVTAKRFLQSIFQGSGHHVSACSSKTDVATSN